MLPAPGVKTGEIRVRNAWHMLLYAWDLAQWKDRWNAQSEAAPNLLGLVARVLADSTELILRRQLARAFRNHTDEIRGIRGKIRITRSLLSQSFQAGKAVCTFPQLSIDNAKTRIVLATLARLAGDPRLETGAAPEDSRRLRHDLRALVRAMEGVTLIRLQVSDFSALQLGRNDEPYRLPLTLCALVQSLEMPTEEEGDQALGALVRDEIRFCDLFERFVRNFFRHHLRMCRVESETLTWWDEIGSPYVPSMRTDISITWPDGRRIVLDTKYYREYLGSHYEGHDKFLSGHLYQVYTYLRTQEHQGVNYRNAEGILLYPASPGIFSQAMRVQGHTIRIETVDLSRSWEDIEARLREIPSSLPSIGVLSH